MRVNMIVRISIVWMCFSPPSTLLICFGTYTMNSRQEISLHCVATCPHGDGTWEIFKRQEICTCNKNGCGYTTQTLKCHCIMYSSNSPPPKPGVDTDLPFLVWLEPTRRLCQSQYSFSE